MSNYSHSQAIEMELPFNLNLFLVDLNYHLQTTPPKDRRACLQTNRLLDALLVKESLGQANLMMTMRESQSGLESASLENMHCRMEEKRQSLSAYIL